MNSAHTGATEHQDRYDNLDPLEPFHEGDGTSLPQYLATVNRPAVDEDGVFVIDTEAKADWTMCRYAQHERDSVKDNALAAMYIEQVNDWLTKREHHHDGAMEHLRSLLQGWFRGWHTEHPREKSCSLPGGVIGERKQSPQIEKNDDALLTWAKANAPECVKVTETVDWSALKAKCALNGSHAVYTATGEEIPAVTLTPRDSSFYVKVKE
jgi:hypothetical protein